MLLITFVPTYFVKVLVHSDVYLFRYQLDTFPGFPHFLLLALAALSTQGFMASWEYPGCSTDRVSGPGKGGCAGVAPFPFEKSRTNVGFKSPASEAMYGTAREIQTQTTVGP